MKNILAVVFTLFSLCSVAQLAGKISLIRPTGALGAGVKPAIGAEIFYKSYDSDDAEHSGFSLRAGIGFIKFTPRQDTFPTYGVISGQGTTVTPGYTVIHKYNLANISFGADYMIRITDKFHIYPGAEVSVLFSSLDYESYTPLISSEGYSGGYVYIGLRLRAGAEYFITDNITVFTEATRSMNFSPEVGGLAYNDYGFGLRYNF